MIMTKEKARELSAISKNRLGATETTPTDGLYMIASVKGTESVRQLAETSSVDYFMLGMVIPAHKAAAVCRLLEDEDGNLPSPLVMMKKSDCSTSALSSRQTSITPSATRMNSMSEDATMMHDESVISIKNIEIIPGRHEVKVDGESVMLTFSEFRILQTLATKPGWVFSREKIIHAVHGDDYNCTERAVDVQVTGLRKKLGAGGDHIETVRGVGYRFSE